MNDHPLEFKNSNTSLLSNLELFKSIAFLRSISEEKKNTDQPINRPRPKSPKCETAGKKRLKSRARDSTTRFVGPSVRPSVCHTLLFSGFCGLWPHRSCPSDQVTSNTAHIHPNATGVALYPALPLEIPNQISTFPILK